MKGLLLDSSEKSECMRRAKAGMEEWREGEGKHDGGRNLEIHQRVEKQVGVKVMWQTGVVV